MEDIYFYFVSFSEAQQYESTTHFKIVLPIRGTTVISTEKKQQTISAGQFCLLPARYMYTLSSNESNENLVIELPDHYIRPFLQNQTADHYQLIWNINIIWQQVKDLLIYEVMQHNHDEATLLLHYWLHKMTETPASASIRYIHQHYTEKINIKKLAAMEHYTPSYYCDWFKRQMHMTPLEYIHYLRIHRAKELLGDPKLSVLTISYQLGYEYNASFTKMFKKYEHCSPSEYRAVLHS
ncbi:AraC family transcriptional regulator [Sporolactobacillus sp. CPB3-1]|uniref:AraC family transcriptional regulator n=1 Tax=Sporolactobacillus mangiferae TaxID=2940498 RepID=A0ABT0M8G3_9BACL|nr:AraC family transcriptional regulator [Sporolactobacillus mangiferae]MCL1631164.1 AraC family transcriptional regulator [Sporolactobacillus mangiferae]